MEGIQNVHKQNYNFKKSTRSQAQIQENTEMSYDREFANIMNMQSDRRSKTGFP